MNQLTYVLKQRVNWKSYRRFLNLEDEVLSEEYVMKNGKKFGEDFGYGGDEYDSFIIQYDQDNNEHIFTSIIYDCYENGNLANYYMVKNGTKNGEMVSFYPNGQVKEIKHIDNNTLEGVQKEFYENGAVKIMEHRVLGRIVRFKKYDEQGKVVEEKKQAMKSDQTYINEVSKT